MAIAVRTLAGLIVLLALNGCATHREWLVTGASRADATVDLSYERNEFQSVQMDMQEGERIATQKCSVWGYKGAEALGSEKSTCTSRRGFGNCGSRTVTVQFQCIGAPSKSE